MQREREVRDYIEGLGGKVVDIRRGKHWFVKAEFDAGMLNVVLSTTPSCGRGMLNNRAWIRRKLMEMKRV